MAKLKPDFRQSTAAMFLTLKDEPEEIQGALESENSNAVTEIPISEIDDFPDHPFHVVVDDAMNEMADSIKKHGVLTPAVVRKKDDGRYELISGHRRKKACEIAGIDFLPAVVREMDRDESIIFMVDSNLQRESLLPSEKAFSYKMRLEAMNRKAGRPSRENLTQVGSDLEKRRTNEELGAIVGESREQIRRYVRLMKSKRIIAVLLCALTVIGLMPTAALAAESTVTIESQTNSAFDYLEYYKDGSWHDLNTPRHVIEQTGEICYCIEHSEGNPHGDTYTAASPSSVFSTNTLAGVQAIMMYGYPCNTPSGFTADEARQATANALRFWLSENGESGSYSFTNRKATSMLWWSAVLAQVKPDFTPSPTSCRLILLLLCLTQRAKSYAIRAIC